MGRQGVFVEIQVEDISHSPHYNNIVLLSGHVELLASVKTEPPHQKICTCENEGAYKLCSNYKLLAFLYMIPVCVGVGSTMVHIGKNFI